MQNESGKKIRELRKNAGMTMASFAQKIGVSMNTIYRLEVGMHRPSMDTMVRISYHMGVPIQDIANIK